jgi:predicted NAD/FAD-dependent oxidoreductase
LLENSGLAELASTAAAINFDYEPITTCYLHYDPELRLPRAFYALADDPRQQRWGQFVFDRGQLHASQAGLLSVVVSASTDSNALNHTELAAALAHQLAADFQLPSLTTPNWSQVITEKRATFSCTPGLKRPDNRTGITSLFIAGDYTACAYPATLEAAVRSGVKAAAELMGNLSS